MIYGRQGVVLDVNGKSPNFPGSFGVRIVPRSILPVTGGVWPGIAGDVRVPFYLQPLQDAGGEVDSGVGTAQPVPIVETDFRWRGRNKLNGWRVDGPPGGTFDAWWTTDPDDEWGSPGLVRVPVVLYDMTSAANTALDTGPIGLADFDFLHAEATATGAGTTQIGPFIVREDGSLYNRNGTWSVAASNAQDVGWGPGCTATTSIPLGFMLPPRAKFATTAGGVGISVRLRVVAFRR